jgi:hypothetical protein
MFDTPYMVAVDFISTQNTLINTEGGIFEIQLDNDNGVYMRGDGFAVSRIANVNNGIGNAFGANVQIYGRRIRTFLYINPSTGQAIKVNSVLIDGTWQNTGIINNTSGNPFVTGLDKIQLARWHFGRSTMKFKTFAILKDFTGISNIQAYMQALSLRPSI